MSAAAEPVTVDDRRSTMRSPPSPRTASSRPCSSRARSARPSPCPTCRTTSTSPGRCAPATRRARPPQATASLSSARRRRCPRSCRSASPSSASLRARRRSPRASGTRARTPSRSRSRSAPGTGSRRPREPGTTLDLPAGSHRGGVHGQRHPERGQRDVVRHLRRRAAHGDGDGRLRDGLLDPEPPPDTNPGAIGVFVQCVTTRGDTFDAVFGYQNDNEDEVTISGSANRFAPLPENRGQTTSFAPGNVQEAFTVTGVPRGTPLEWSVTTPAPHAPRRRPPPSRRDAPAPSPSPACSRSGSSPASPPSPAAVSTSSSATRATTVPTSRSRRGSPTSSHPAR